MSRIREADAAGGCLLSIEKRRHERRDYVLPLRIEIGGQIIEGSTSNVSLGGFRAEVAAEIAFGTKVLVHVRFPALGEESVIAAEVRWNQTDSDGRRFVGLQFQRVRARETWALNQLLRG